VVVGDGPERASLAALVRARGLEGCVRLLGWRSQAEVGELMRAADVFAFPSIRELGAGAVVEAMATGLPCVVVDYGGPGGLVEGIGVKVPLGEKPALVRGFRAELERLAISPDLRARLGVASARRALAEYAWDAKAAQILRVYDWVLGRSAKPVVRSAGAPPSRARAVEGA
jgi:glycosyltransferase involved in cell wall biosynthesis